MRVVSYARTIKSSEELPCLSFSTKIVALEIHLIRSKREKQRNATLKLELLEFIQTINAVAKGLAPDFYAIIKEAREKEK